MAAQLFHRESIDRILAVAGKVLFAGMTIAWLAVSAAFVVLAVRYFGGG